MNKKEYHAKQKKISLDVLVSTPFYHQYYEHDGHYQEDYIRQKDFYNDLMKAKWSNVPVSIVFKKNSSAHADSVHQILLLDVFLLDGLVSVIGLSLQDEHSMAKDHLIYFHLYDLDDLGAIFLIDEKKSQKDYECKYLQHLPLALSLKKQLALLSSSDLRLVLKVKSPHFLAEIPSYLYFHDEYFVEEQETYFWGGNINFSLYLLYWLSSQNKNIEVMYPFMLKEGLLQFEKKLF